MKSFIVFLLAALPLTAPAENYRSVVISDADHRRALDIVSGMTLEQKCHIIAGVPARAVGDGYQEAGKVKDQNTLAGCAAVGIPDVYMADGPQGINNKFNPKAPCTYYACGLSAAASFDREAVLAMGDGLGTDARARGVGFLLGPGANIYRAALCGRNYEYFGEDPYLSGEVAACYVKGVQRHGVIATVKHFACNNQEWDRFIISANVDERTLHEIYFPPFRKAVQEGGAGAVMMSCGRLNDVPCAQNEYLLKNTLRKDWGFKGVTMCDWQTLYSTLGGIRAGLDIEMPNPLARRFDRIRSMIDNGVIREAEIDSLCVHVVQTLSAFGILDRPLKDDSLPENNPYCHRKAYEAAVGAPVLIRNNGILPVKSAARKKILVTGPFCDAVCSGGGSGYVNAYPGAYVTTYRGLRNMGWNVIKAEKPSVKQLEGADLVIVEVGFNFKLEGENHDHAFSLPMDQEELIQKAVEYSSKVVVIVHSGCEVDMRAWHDRSAAIIYGWYGGEHTGTVLSQILSGEVSPSGRLPFTMWGSFENNPASSSYFADKFISYHGRLRFKENPHVDYKEGVFVGYRGIEKFGREPLYPFGFGLSYSQFGMSDLKVEKSGDGFNVSFTITNTGRKDAAQVAQVYVSEVAPCVPRPVRELKQFTKVFLKKGESRRISLFVDSNAFEYFDVPSHSWKTNPGEFLIQVGDNEQSILLQKPVRL